MALWSAAFRERMLLGGEPMYAIDFKSADFLSVDSLTLARYVLHSHGRPGTDAGHIPDAITRCTGGGQSVSLRTWRSSMGGLRVELSGADIAQFVAREIPRGLVAQLKIGFQGMAYEDFEPVGLYQYRNLNGSRSTWVMEFNDILGALQAANSLYLSSQFMKQAGEQTTTASGWTVGGSVLSVHDGSNLLLDGSTGARGLLYAQPTTGEPFYLKYTAVVGGVVTVVNADVFDTTRVDLEAGDTITALGYIQDSLPDAVQMLLFGGIVGASTMPDQWNLGINWSASTVNSGDFTEWRSRWLSAYAEFGADFIQSSPVQNPYRAIEEYMAAFGSWLVMKEGRLSWRFVQRMVKAGDLGADAHIDRIITDEDIAGEETYQLYHPDCQAEYFQVKFAGHSTLFTDGGSVGTEPGIFRLDHESKNWVYDDDVLAANKANAYSNMWHRIGPWYTRVPDAMQLTLAGWRHADLVPGDVIQLQSQYLLNMLNVGIDAHGLPRFTRHTHTLYMVTAVDVDWDGFTTNIELSSPPYSSTRYS